jgi:hypothetical protein
MDIKLNTKVASVARPATAPTAAVRTSSQPTSVAEFGSSQALETKLAVLPATRAAAVERARDLIGDTTYPPRETIQRIATLLALEIQASGN